jgi:hypothetical protein
VQALGRQAVLLRKPFELGELESAATRLLSPRVQGEERRDAL